jgi:hypothetical protein
MIHQVAVVGLSLVVATSAVSIKNLQRRSRLASPIDVAQVPESFLEAGYTNEEFSEFGAKQQRSLAELNRPMAPHIPQVITKFHQVNFYDHGYEFEPMYEDDMSLLETSTEVSVGQKFHRDTKISIGVVPASYQEAMYSNVAASSFLEIARPWKGRPEIGEDFRISKHGRTEDVDDPDYEINHPSARHHSKNVIGTKQEGHLFWTDTVQPNPETYESTHHKKIRLANSIGGDDQAFSAPVENDADATQLECAGCQFP